MGGLRGRWGWWLGRLGRFVQVVVGENGYEGQGEVDE